MHARRRSPYALLTALLAAAIAVVAWPSPSAQSSTAQTTAIVRATRPAVTHAPGVVVSEEHQLRAIHQLAARHLLDSSAQVSSVVVRHGQTLSDISRNVYGHAADWPVLYFANKHKIRNPWMIRVGWRLTVPPLPRHIPVYNPPAPPASTAGIPPQQPSAVSSAPHTLSGAAATPFGACVRLHENDDSYAWGTGDGGGAYQFEEPTWNQWAPQAEGGAWGSADPAQQDAAFNAAIAGGDASAWDADGCPHSFGLDAVSAQLISATTMHRHHDHARWLRWVEREALAWAKTQRGRAYCYGGTGPSCYDCSGLVMTAFRHAGFGLQRTAAEMQASRRLRQVSMPQLGDVVLYGWPAFHAALYAGHHRIFDALDSGTPVGSQPATWPGTPIYYEIV